MSNIEQLDLDFARTHTRTTNPSTSYDAALSVVSSSKAQCMVIRRVLQEYGPQTADSAAQLCSLDRVQIGRRLSDLERFGWAYPNGTTAKISTGRHARVWESL